MVATTRHRLTQHPKTTLTIIGVLLIMFALWPTLQAALTPSPAPHEIFHHGAIRVGLDPSRPPFATFDENGNYIGLEIDLARALGDEIGMDVTFIGLGFDGLYDALKTNQADLIIAGLQPVLHHDANAAVYSRHYFNAGQVLVSSTPDQTMRDLADGSLSYAFGSPSDALAHRWLRRIRPFDLYPYERPQYALDATRLDITDAALTDAISARLYLRETDWNAHTSYVEDAWYTIAIRGDRPDILQTVNHALHTLDAQGTLDALLDEWL